MPKDKEKNDWFWDGITGILFVILPLIVLVIVRLYQESTFWGLLAFPEWSFGSAILFGQSIIKVIHAVARSRGDLIVVRLNLFVSGLIVIGLVPSLVVLSLILIESTPQNWLVILQIFLFVLACFVFITSRGIESMPDSQIKS